MSEFTNRTGFDNQDDRLPLETRISDQLLKFSEAARSIKLAIEQGGIQNSDDLRQKIDELGFSPRQVERFLEGAGIYLHRRQITQSAKKEYTERYPDSSAQKLFTDILGVSGTFGKIEMHDNNQNLIFVCDSVIDVGQALSPGKDITVMAAGLSPEEFAEMEKDVAKNVPLGVFLKREVVIPGIGKTDSIIVINNAEAIRREQDIDTIVAHESQHAENNVYHRPLLEDFLKQSESISNIAQAITKWDAAFAPYSGVDSEEARKLVTELFTEFEKLLRDLFDRKNATTIEGTIKEEVLAFHLSGQNEEEIQDIFPAYIVDAKRVFVSAFDAFETLLQKHIHPKTLEILGIDAWGIKTRTVMTGFARMCGKVKTEGKETDPLVRLRNDFGEKLDALGKEWEQQVNEALDVFKKIEAYDAAHGTDWRDKLVPILISQPLPRWAHVVNSIKHGIIKTA